MNVHLTADAHSSTDTGVYSVRRTTRTLLIYYMTGRHRTTREYFFTPHPRRSTGTAVLHCQPVYEVGR